MSPSGLQKVLQGSQPFPATRTKLERWYQEHRSGGPDSAREEAIQFLLRGVPPSRRKQARKEIWSALGRDCPPQQDDVDAGGNAQD